MRVKIFSPIDSKYKYGKGVIEEALKKALANNTCKYAHLAPDVDFPSPKMSDIAAEIENIESDDEGNIWADVSLMDTPKGKIAKEMLDSTNARFSVYGYGRAKGDTIIDYEIWGIGILPNGTDRENTQPD